MLVNQRELSEIVGVSTVSLTEWQKDGMPMIEREKNGSPNAYEPRLVIEWMIQREMKRASIETPQDRLARVRADREEIELAKLRNTVVDVNDVQPLMDRYVSDVLNTLHGLPERYAPLLQQVHDADGQHQLLVNLVKDIQVILGDYEFRTQPSAGDHSALPAAA